MNSKNYAPDVLKKANWTDRKNLSNAIPTVKYNLAEYPLDQTKHINKNELKNLCSDQGERSNSTGLKYLFHPTVISSSVKLHFMRHKA